MKIHYLGTGAAEGVPAMFCSCEYCTKIREIGESEWRTRTQILIDDELSVDFPPEAYYHAVKHGVSYSRLKYVLVTHSHMDHFYAHDFILHGYKYGKMEEDKLEIYGNAEVMKVFAECTAREMKEEVRKTLSTYEIKPYELYTVGEYKVAALPARHTQTEDALIYYIERKGKGYLHIFDTNTPEEKVYKFLKEIGAKAQVVSLDCTFGSFKGNVNARHMGINEDVLVKQKLLEYGVINEQCKIVITHFSHNCNPLRENLKTLEKKYGVIAAYDGMVIDF